MSEGRRICVRQILDKFVSGIYKGAGYAVILIFFIGFFLLFIYPHYQEYDYMKKCQQGEYQEDWCKRTWIELQKLD